MIKRLKKMYHRVGGERFEAGLSNIGKLVALAFLFALFSSLISGCRKEDEVQLYEVKTSGVMYQTSENNKRLKEPVETETVYFVVGGER